MKLYLAALVVFLLAFSGLAAGLILKRRGLKGGCTPTAGTDRDCPCKTEEASSPPGQNDRDCSEEDNRFV